MCVQCVHDVRESRLSRSEQLVGYVYNTPLQRDRPTVWPIHDRCCVLHQPAASPVYLLQLTPAQQTALTMLDQGARNCHNL